MDTQILNTVKYSDKSFVVYGELTRMYKEHLKQLGGRFNGRLKPKENWDGGAGWIFGIRNKDVVMDFVDKVNKGEFSLNAISNDTGLPIVNPQVSQYQWVKFKIFKPENGMKVILKVNNDDREGNVISTDIHNNIVDTVYINFGGQTSMAVIENCKWQIKGYMEKHSLFFDKN